MQVTNKNNYPLPVVAACERPPHKVIPNRYSVTSLLNPATQVVLNRRHSNEIEQDVGDMMWALMGTAFHKMLEDGASKPELSYLETELKLTTELNGCTVSGILDLYDPKTKTVSDYKTTSVWTAIKEDYEKYRKQLLIYAYMMSKKGYQVEKVEAVLFLRDFSKTKSKFDPNYPDKEIISVSWPVSEKDLKDTEDFLIGQLQTIQTLEKISDEDLPACPPADRWNDGDKFAVMAKGKKRALRVLESREEAEKYLEKAGDFIEVREGQDRRCEAYCSVNGFCKYYANTRKD